MNYQAVRWKDPKDKRVVLAITDSTHIYERGHAGYVFRHNSKGATKLHTSELPNDAFYAFFGREKPADLKLPKPLDFSGVPKV